MHVLILGGGGMIGQKLIHELARNPQIDGQSITEVTLVDAFIEPKIPQNSNFPITSLIANITNKETCEKLIENKPELIFHLAAIVSGEAESNFEIGRAHV